MICYVTGCRQGKFQVLQYNSNVKIVRLLVEVTNVPSPGKLAEDAHQAMLNITIPDALRYSAVRSPVCPLGGSRGTSSFEFNCQLHRIQITNITRCTI